MNRVIVEVIHSNIYICINLKLHDSEHVCSEENIGLPDLPWRTEIKRILNIYFCSKNDHSLYGSETTWRVNYDHLNFLVN